MTTCDEGGENRPKKHDVIYGWPLIHPGPFIAAIA